ncbi:MAG: preprotein translocase subunit SecA [Candidatus Margulisbacteria bacterium]|nr:preprotein translocase subunit SecA [Candidatus Margulisiibacteriota bacterium]
MVKWLSSIFGNSNEKRLAPYWEIVQQINNLEPEIKKLTDQQIQHKTAEYRQLVQEGKNLDELLPEAFALVREAAVRALKMRHFDVQILGGIILHQGKITEMKTGEGKTLVATLPVYLNALLGKGVHVVTVNDYLAKRDAAWMGKVYNFLGLSVGVIYANMPLAEKRFAYQCDITYGTNNEFGFDYLRDNMAIQKEQCVQKELHYAIVDEVDSILIDEARTPLIISGMAEGTVDKYKKLVKVARQLQKDKDFTLEEKTKHATLTEEGIAHVEKILGIDSIYDIAHMDLAHMLVQALKAIYLFKRDVDYVVNDGEIVIVDEFTGRLMVGRRYSEGLHQGIEAKENVKIQEESQTLASITLQNYFRMYKKLAGMTGTAVTEEAEFSKIYKLDVFEIPTHMPMIRKDFADVIYKSQEEKFKAIVKEVKERHEKGQPMLVGTISIENSERLGGMLQRTGIKHNVLNAKNHALEAEIIAKAGEKNAVTIATNMAGRGTDIVLGEGVKELGGLHVIGTERHESRRIDNQLRGRSGRQGDQGSSRFYVALDDDLMRLFGGGRVASLMGRLGLPADTPIEHGLITRSIEKAQHKVEQYHFSIRKQVLEYDDVMNRQRESIYSLRRKILEGKNLKEKIQEMLMSSVNRFVKFQEQASLPLEQWDWDIFSKQAAEFFPFDNSAAQLINKKSLDGVKKQLLELVKDAYINKEKTAGEKTQREIERLVLLRVLDTQWIDHLHNMDALRDGIGLRAYGQRDPLIEYKIEAFKMFEALMAAIEDQTIETIFKAQIVREEAPAPVLIGKNLQYSNPEEIIYAEMGEPAFAEASADRPYLAEASNFAKASVDRSAGGPSQKNVQAVAKEKVGRNELCPCGSGKKYKKCCGN